MQRKQTALRLFWSIVFVPQRKQRVYPYLRRGDSFGLSQNNEILLDRHHTPPGLLPSDELLPPSLPPKTVTFPISWKRFQFAFFGSDARCSISVSWATRAEFSKLNELIIFSCVFSPSRIFYLSSSSSMLRRFGRTGWYGRTDLHLGCTSV